MRDRGATFAIANTTVSGVLTPWLRKTGFILVSLVHEMTEVLREMHLEQATDELTENADVVVFPRAWSNDSSRPSSADRSKPG